MGGFPIRSGPNRGICFISDEEAFSQHPNGRFGEEKTFAGVSMVHVGPELGRETDALLSCVHNRA